MELTKKACTSTVDQIWLMIIEGHCPQISYQVRHIGLVVSFPACDETGREFDSWQCRIYIPCSLSLRLLGSLQGSLGTYGFTQKLC